MLIAKKIRKGYYKVLRNNIVIGEILYCGCDIEPNGDTIDRFAVDIPMYKLRHGAQIRVGKNGYDCEKQAEEAALSALLNWSTHKLSNMEEGKKNDSI